MRTKRTKRTFSAPSVNLDETHRATYNETLSVNLEEMLAAEKLALEAEERDRAELILKLSPPKPACGEAAMPPEEEVAPMPKDIKMISPCEKTSFVIQTIVFLRNKG